MIESPSNFKLDERFLTSIRSLNLGNLALMPEANAHNWRKILCMAGWSHLRKINLSNHPHTQNIAKSIGQVSGSSSLASSNACMI